MSYKDSDLQFDSKLVLCIEECEYDNTVINNIDHRMFIVWSPLQNTFCIKGKRQNVGGRDYPPYSFCFESINSVVEFINSLTCDNKINVTLYNYNNIDGLESDSPQDCLYNLDYEFFEINMDPNYELSGCEGFSASTDAAFIASMLRSVKEAFNIDFKVKKIDNETYISRKYECEL